MFQHVGPREAVGITEGGRMSQCDFLTLSAFPLVPYLIPTSCVPYCAPSMWQDRVQYLRGLLEKHETQKMTLNMVRYSWAAVQIIELLVYLRT